MGPSPKAFREIAVDIPFAVILIPIVIVIAITYVVILRRRGTRGSGDPFGQMGPTLGLGKDDKYMKHYAGFWYIGKLVPGSEPSTGARVAAGLAGATWTTTLTNWILTDAGDLVITEERAARRPEEILRFTSGNKPQIRLASDVVEMPAGETDDRPNKFHGGNILSTPHRLLAITPSSGERIFMWAAAKGADEIISWSRN